MDTRKYDIALGRLLKTYRKKAGLTQKEFADHFGISRELVCNYEKGYRSMNASLFFAICDFLSLDAVEVAEIVKDMAKER